MTKTHKTSLLAVAILGFGLVSCSKETEVRYQEDQFQPRDILVEKTDRSFTALNNLTVLDYSRQLVINEEQTGDKSEIKNLVLSTSCRTQSSPTASSLNSQWPNPTKINVLDILPDDILLHRSNEVVYCELSYTTTNGYNSTNTGKVSNVKIENMDSFSNLASAHPLAQENVIWASVEDGSIVPIDNASSKISCSDFSYTSNTLTTTATKDQVLPPSAYLQKNVKSAVQQCRALFKTKDKMALTPVFNLFLPIIAPSITYSFSQRIETDIPVDSKQAVTYQIQNHNPYPITLRVSATGVNFLVSVILHVKGDYVPSHAMSLPIQWSFQGQPVDLVTHEQVIEIPANSKSYLVGSVQGSIDCAVAKNSGFTLVGTNADLSSPVAFKFKDSLQKEQSDVGTFVGTTYVSPSPLRIWDIALNWVDSSQANINRVVQWVRWHRAFEISPDSNNTSVACARK